MSQPYVGEIRLFAGNFAPVGWSTCDGQTLAINENETLFNLIGTTYGGDGQTTFKLPNLAGRAPVHMGTGRTGTNYTLAQSAGVTSVTLVVQQIPSHSHVPVADGNGATTDSPANAYFAGSAPQDSYTVPNSPSNPDAPALRAMNPAVLPNAGGSQPHSNMQPYLAVTFIISIFGVFPSPS